MFTRIYHQAKSTRISNVIIGIALLYTGYYLGFREGSYQAALVLNDCILALELATQAVNTLDNEILAMFTSSY